MSNKSCPVSLISVDGNIARINAFYVGLFFTLYLISLNSAIVYLLILDFMIRLFLNKDYSLLFMLSIKTKQIFKIQTQKVDGAAKKLASLFGLFFLISIALFSLLHLTSLFYILSAVLIVCISLEVLFSYCLGCEIYHIYKKFIV